MFTEDHLKPFWEVSRAFSDDADSAGVMHLITRRISETLELKGCLIKLSDSAGRLETIAAHGLSEQFLFGKPDSRSETLCFRLPDKIECVSDICVLEDYQDYELLMVEGIRSAAIAPIDFMRKPAGMVALFGSAAREFDSVDLNFAMTLATLGVQALLREREAEEALNLGYRYFQDLREVSRAVHSSLAIEEVLRLAARKISEILNARGCAIRLLDPQSNELKLAHSFGLSQEFISKGPVNGMRSIRENLLGDVVVIEDARSEPRLQYPQHVIDEGIRKIISIPLAVPNNVLGVLRVYCSDRPPFAEHEIQFAASIGEQCALAIDNASRYRRITDGYQQLMSEAGYIGSS